MSRIWRWARVRKRCGKFFAPDGVLAQALSGDGERDYEERVEQRIMAEAVARAAEEKHHLLVEAGTGTGKSYAYLAPLILWAVENNKRVLVATHTKALQQQLVERDLPFLKKLFKEKLGTDFRFALCLGSGNYVCPRRLAKAESGGGLFASRDDIEEMKELQHFANKEQNRTQSRFARSSRSRICGRKSTANRICVWGATARCTKILFSTSRAASRKKRRF